MLQTNAQICNIYTDTQQSLSTTVLTRTKQEQGKNPTVEQSAPMQTNVCIEKDQIPVSN